MHGLCSLVSFLFLILAMIIQPQLTCSGHESEMKINHNGVDQMIDCGAACAYRCSKASRQHMCLRACGTCCVRCNCVPPGTSGNIEVCPCYATMTTHSGRPKCP